MHADHKFRVEFQTRVEHPDYPDMDSHWTLMGSAETLHEGEEIMAAKANQYVEIVKTWKQKPNRVFRLLNEHRVMAEVNTITGETRALLQRIK